MGRFVDLDKPLSPEDKQYLRERGRTYLIPANERRFGVNGDREPEEHEAAGAAAVSPFYDTQERDRAVYDVGGAPLPGTVLDKNTGRVFDRDNGTQLVEPRFGNPQPGSNANPNPFGGQGDLDEQSEDDLDDDIVEEVEGLTIPQLESRLKEEGLEVPEKADLSGLSVEELRSVLKDELNVGYNASDKKADLLKSANSGASKERKYKMQETLAIHLQDKRDGKV